MCSKPKVKTQETVPDPILLTRQDTQPSGAVAAARRRNKLRMDLNNATYQGLAIPNG